MELDHKLFAKRNPCQIFHEGYIHSVFFILPLRFFSNDNSFVEKDPSKGVFFFIKVSDGHKLGNLSAFPQEQEVLLEPGSEFIVTGSVCFNETLVVNLEQTPSTNLIVPLSDLFAGLFCFPFCDFLFSLFVFFFVLFLWRFHQFRTFFKPDDSVCNTKIFCRLCLVSVVASTKLFTQIRHLV